MMESPLQAYKSFKIMDIHSLYADLQKVKNNSQVTDMFFVKESHCLLLSRLFRPSFRE